MTAQKTDYNYFQRNLFAFFLFVMALLCLGSVAEAQVAGAWEVIHEPADDKTITSTAFIINESGDRISLSINAVQKKKVCVLKLGTVPLLPSNEYHGKMIIDNVSVWEGKIISSDFSLGDLLILDLGFDWSQLLKGLKKGRHLIITYEGATQKPIELKFTLKGSTRAIDAMLDKQTEILRKRSDKKQQ